MSTATEQRGNRQAMNYVDRAPISEVEIIDATVDRQKLTSMDGIQDEDEMALAQPARNRNFKAEEKRLEGLKRIAERKSSSGTKPYPLPPEIWAKILGRLGTRDRYNLYQVHTFFQDLMEDTKIQDILLPMAMDHKIPLLRMVLQLYDWNVIKNPIMTLRLVSKEVRKSVDKWIEDDILCSMRGSCLRPTLHPVPFTFTDKLQVLNRMSAFSGTAPSRPKKFVPRTIQVDCCYSHLFGNAETMRLNLSAFQENFTQLLGKIGGQILFLRLEFDPLSERLDIDMAPIIHNMIREWLELMPSLMWLEVSTESVLELAQGREQQSMPRLNALERINLPVRKKNPILDAILTANPHVKYLMDLEHQRNTPPFIHPSIRSLHLETVSLGNQEDLWNFRIFQEILGSGSGWKLRKMTLWMKNAPIYALFRSISENFPHLEDVTLRFKNIFVDKTCHFLALPNLKNLEIEFGPLKASCGNDQFFFSLQFLLQCKKLESLIWMNMLNHCYSNMMREQERLGQGVGFRYIDFLGEGTGEWDLSTSNVWQVFKQLRCIKVILQGWAAISKNDVNKGYLIFYRDA